MQPRSGPCEAAEAGLTRPPRHAPPAAGLPPFREARASRSSWPSGQVLDHGPRRQQARRAGHGSAGMGAGARQVKGVDPTEAAAVRTIFEQLAGKHLAVEDMPAGDAEAFLQLPRAE